MCVQWVIGLWSGHLSATCRTPLSLIGAVPFVAMGPIAQLALEEELVALPAVAPAHGLLTALANSDLGIDCAEQTVALFGCQVGHVSF